MHFAFPQLSEEQRLVFYPNSRLDPHLCGFVDMAGCVYRLRNPPIAFIISYRQPRERVVMICGVHGYAPTMLS